MNRISGGCVPVLVLKQQDMVGYRRGANVESERPCASSGFHATRFNASA